jgi:hypothetical protein
VNGPAGGPKLLRGLLEAEHPPVLSIYTGLDEVAPLPGVEEIYLPRRPEMGRIDRSRFHSKMGVFDRIFRSRFKRRLRQIFTERGVKCVHVIPHAYDVVAVQRVASEMHLPSFITVHDDIESTVDGHPFKNEAVAATAELWRTAKAAFAISGEIGREYCRRYGEREFAVVTDGLKSIPDAPKQWDRRSFQVYFMGLFNVSYQSNFRAVLDALRMVRDERPDWNISVTSRSGYIHCPLRPDDVPVKVVQFSKDVREAERDMLTADLLYQPMTFDIAAFGKFSMSTKMVSYLGSGIPILYHGPEFAAACKLLADHNAAICCTSLDPQVIARQLIDAMPEGETIASNALVFARSQFMLADQQRRFWRPIQEAMQ